MGRDSAIIRTVAENVRRLRAAAGLSQEQLAFAAELDRTYISQVEGQKRNITISALAQLAKALKVEPTELVAETKKRKK